MDRKNLSSALNICPQWCKEHKLSEETRMSHQQPAHMHIVSCVWESQEGVFNNSSVVAYALIHGKMTVCVNIVGFSGTKKKKKMSEH